MCSFPYASEHGDEVASPLAQVLTTLGVSVWFDQTELKIGDNLRRRIDEGLANCRYGAVLLSTAFFGKHYTNQELDGLSQREVNGVKVILPVWVDVEEADVRAYSPVLANRLAAKWADGLYVVASKLIAEIRPDILASLAEQQARAQVPRVRTGGGLVSAFATAQGIYAFNDALESEQDVELVAGFIQQVSDWSEIWEDLEIGGRIEAEFGMTKLIEELEAAGWSVFAKQVDGRVEFGGRSHTLRGFCLAVLRGAPHEVQFRDGNLMVARRPDETAQEEVPRSGNHGV